MSEDAGTRVEVPSWGYTLRSARRIEYASPLVSRVSRSHAHDDVNDNDELDLTQVQPSQAPLFDSDRDAGRNSSGQSPSASGEGDNLQEKIQDLKK